MRNITVDFSQRPPLISDKYAGEIGEHQATTLNIIPETNMSTDTDIAFYYVLFKVEGGLVASRTFSQGEDISIALWGQLLEDRRLTFQLIGTNGLESIISKSPILTLYLGDSLEGTVIGIDDNRDSLIAMIGAFNERLDDDEEKLSTIQEGAEANVIDEIDSFDGNALPVVNKVVTLPDTSPLEIRKSPTELLYTPAQINTEYQKGRPLVFGGVAVIRWFYRASTNSTFLVLAQNGNLSLYSVLPQSVDYFERQVLYMSSEEGAEANVIDEIDTADGTALSVSDKVVALPDFVLPSALNGYIEKPSSASDGNALIYNATESKWDAAPRVKNTSGMTGAEIKAAWNRGDDLKIVYSDQESKVIKVRDYTNSGVEGVLVSCWWHDRTPAPELRDREFIRHLFWPLNAATPSGVSSLSRYAVPLDKLNALYDGSVASGNTSFVTGEQVYNAIQGGGGASAMIVTFTTENDDIVSDYTIHEIVTAHNSGSVVFAKMMNEGAEIEFVFNLSAALEVEGIALAEFTSIFDSGDDAVVVSILGTNEGEGDTWQGLNRAIPEEITTTTSVSQYSTDDEVPTAKAVYDAIKPDFVVTAEGDDYLKGEMTGGLSVTLTTSKTLTELLAKAANHEELDVKGTIYVEDPDPDYAEEGVFDVQKYDLWYYRYGTADYINYLLGELNSSDTTNRPGIALVFQHTFPRGSNKNVSFDRYTAWAIIVYESESSPGTISYEYTDDLTNLL